MRVYIDLDTLELIESPGNRSSVDRMWAKRGTSKKLELQFVRDGEAELLPALTQIRFGPKPTAEYDGDFVVFTDEFTAPGDATGFYTGYANFNTAEINALLGSPDGNTANDEESVELMAEFSWLVPGEDNPEKSQTFIVQVDNAVDNGDEAAPSEAGPSLNSRITALEVFTEASVIIVHDDGTRTGYVPSADTDAARGTALATALAAAVAGDTVFIAPGDYTTSAQLDLPDGVNIKGSGVESTTIQSLTVAAIVNVEGTSEIEDMTVSGLSTTIYQFPIHIEATATGKTVTLRNLKLTGDTDGLYIHFNSNPVTVFGYNLITRTKFDAVNIFAESGSTIYLYNPDFVVTGPSSAGSADELARAIATTNSGTIYVYGGRVHATDGGTNGTYALSASNGTIQAIGTELYTSSSDSKADANGGVAGTVKIAACVGSGTNGNVTTSGTVTFLDDVDAVTARNTLGASSGVWPVSLGGTGVSSLPKFSAHKNGVAQSIAASTFVKLTGWVAAYDTDSSFASDRYTPKVAGKWRFNAGTEWGAASTVNAPLITIYKNGAEAARLQWLTFSGISQVSISGSKTLEANGTTDYFEAYVLHSDSAARDVVGTIGRTWFEGEYVP